MENRFISLDPDQYLVFKRPFNTVKVEILKIRNVTTSTVVFKVKTTAPKQYIVVPNCGEIKVGETKEVEIRLQTMADDFAPDFKCKDKFLVQSMKFNDEILDQVRSSPKELQALLMEKFQEVDRLKKLNPADIKKILCENKLNCVYVQPSINGSETEIGKLNQTTRDVASDSNKLTNSLSNEKMNTANITNTTTPSIIISSNNNTSSTTAATTTATAATTAANANNLSSTFKKPAEEKNYKNILPASLTMDESFKCDNLDEAKEKIKELQKALKGYQQDQALRKTVNKEANEKGTKNSITTTKPKSENVIPVEIVAIVALLAFLIGAFCF